jgi:hypothetical protein
LDPLLLPLFALDPKYQAAPVGNDNGIREVHGEEARKLLMKVENTQKTRKREVAFKCFLIVLVYTG